MTPRHLSPTQRVGGRRWLTGKGIPSANRQSPLIVDQGAPRSPGCPHRPSRPGPGCSPPGHLHTHTHTRRSCQNPDILINPGSATLLDAAERWMQKGTTPDPCQGWGEQLLRAPSQPPCKNSPLRHGRALSAPLLPPPPNNDGGAAIHPGAGKRGPRCPPNPTPTQDKRRRASMQTLSHTIGLVSNTKSRAQRKFRVLNLSH